MGEALTTNASDMQSLSLESIRSRLRELSASLDDSPRSSDDSISQPKKLLKDLHHNLLVVAEDPSVASLEPDELEAYIEQLMKMINLEEEENLKVFEEFNTLESIILRDSTKLKGDLEAFSSLVDFIDSKAVFSTQTGIADDSSVSGSTLGSSLHLSEDYKLEIFELSQLIENKRSKLATSEDLHDVMERLDAVNSLKDFFCGVKCIQIEDKCIRFSLRTPIPVTNSLFPIGKPNSYLEPFVLDHELSVEINDMMELKNVEIFPADVHLDDIIKAIESRYYRCGAWRHGATLLLS
ncbi:hypothetical protein HPP92_022949 [Vanilla planifolia]|uniref:Uncharacterized protein n=1 Tax=Vanilla planifolia TaxID=51239 RepID=A0A835UHQ2_VANPL|nr:hypothetical protein HPP92_022949 [Vanilla planifolia]